MVHFYLQQVDSVEVLAEKLEGNTMAFAEESLKIHERLDLIEIENLMREQGLGGEVDVSSTKPLDMAFSAPNLKNLGYSLHKIAKDCLMMVKIGEGAETYLRIADAQKEL